MNPPRMAQAPDRAQSSSVQVPARIYLPLIDEACQLEDVTPAWSATRTGATDIEYVRADLAAADMAPHAPDRHPAPAAHQPPRAGSRAPSAGESLVARWCERWGEDRPSRATQRIMADDIDHAISAVVKEAEASAAAAATAAANAAAAAAASVAAADAAAANTVAAGPGRRTRSARAAAAGQLALELPPPESAAPPSGTPQAPDVAPMSDTLRAPRAAHATPASAQTPGAAQRPNALPAHGAHATEPRAVYPCPPGGEPDPDGWTRFDAYLARLWSSANVEALASLAVQPGGLDVILWPEATNEVDGEAVAIAVELPEETVGGFAAAWTPAARVIGYIARAERRKEALFAALSGAPLGVRLHLEPDGWYVHIARAMGDPGAEGPAAGAQNPPAGAGAPRSE